MTDRISISDMFGSYPDPSDDLFNSKLSRKVEFSELAPEPVESIPDKGGFFKHQEFSVRYGTHFDCCLFIHEPGTGKSCIINGLADVFKNNFMLNPDDPTRINRAIILVRGPTLAENIRNEIVCKCTNRVYETPAVLRASNETQIKAAITRELNKWFDIMSYTDFAKILNELTSTELNQFMSNKAIFADEAHNISSTKEVKQLDIGLEPETQDESEAVEVNRKNYSSLIRGFHSGVRKKIFLFTATPMINFPSEFPYLMNLILPRDFQMPTWSDEQFASLTLDQIEPYLRGRISYIRSANTGVRRVYPDGTIQPEGYNTQIYPCDMSVLQYTSYLKAQKVSNDGFYSDERQVSNFVYPDGKWGVSAAKKYIEYRDKDYVFKENQDGQLLSNLLATDLSYLSGKYDEMVKICLNAYPETRLPDGTVEDYQGVVFIYFPDYVNGSGAIMAGKALEAHGYEEYKESGSIFDGQTGRQSGFCSDYQSSSQGERRSRLVMKKRYSLLTNYTTKAEFNSIMNTQKSYENRYGEYIQVFIASRIGQEGISVNHAVASIVMSSPWNFSRYLQAGDRIFRVTSHEDRLNDKRRKLIKEGKDPAEAVFNVKIYNMASVYYGDPNNPDPRLRETNYNTVDLRMFLLTEQKNKAIRRIIRFCKESAIDCYINYRRNVRPNDIDGSVNCDYTTCAYQCAGIRDSLMKDIDWTTKILFYSEPEVNAAIQAVQNLFGFMSEMTIDQVHKLIPGIEPIFIDLALEKIIRENIRLTDRFGYFGYLRDTPTGEIYIERDPFTIKPVLENTVYTGILIGTQDPRNNVFSDYVTNYEAISQESVISQLLATPPDKINDPLFDQLLNSLVLSNKVALLETAIYRCQSTGLTNPLYTTIISTFDQSIFRFKEPVSALQQIAYALANRGKGRGRKPNTNIKVKVSKLNIDISKIEIPSFDYNGPEEEIIIHTLLNQSFERTNYNTLSKFFKVEGKLRILKMSEGLGWRDLNQYEEITYNELIRRQINRIRAYYENFPIYGIMLPPSNQFRVRDREAEDPSKIDLDLRFLRPGKVCDNWLKVNLVDVLFRLGVEAPDPKQVTLDRAIIIQFLLDKNISNNLDTFSDEKLTYFYRWYRVNPKNSELCSRIYSELSKRGLIFTGEIPAEAFNQVPVAGPASGTINLGLDLNNILDLDTLDIGDIGDIDLEYGDDFD